MKTSDVLHAVSNGLADIGIMFLASSSKDLMIQRIRKLGLVFNNIAYKPVHIYLHESHPLAARPMIYPEELNDYPFITYDLAVDNDSAFTDILNYTQNRSFMLPIVPQPIRFCVTFMVIFPEAAFQQKTKRRTAFASSLCAVEKPGKSVGFQR